MATSTPPPTAGPVNRHALTAVERQRSQLDKLLKDPAKPAFVPAPPKEKTIRPPREMMKNVQGSSAGAGSGEFHVYKASRRREYERLKLLDEMSQKEIDDAEFERKRREADQATDAKTARNRIKRQKKKERSKTKASPTDNGAESRAGEGSSKAEAPIKKRRLVNGKELVFRRPGEESDNEEEGAHPDVQQEAPQNEDSGDDSLNPLPIVDTSRITIHEDD